MNFIFKQTTIVVFSSFLFFTSLAYAVPSREDRYLRLVEKYAPVWVQQVGYTPLFDAITRFDFDGNQSGFDNVSNAEKFPLPAVVYGDLIAETLDSYYIFYGVYHVRDYDKPLREFFIASSRHDNDFEGAMLAVSKESGEILAIETWFHSKFLQFAHVSQMGGDQTIDGKIHVEDITHPILLVQPLGHGVRAFQKIDEGLLGERPYHIYRWGKLPLKTDGKNSIFINYSLLPLKDFVLYSKGPFDKNSMFSGLQDFGLGLPLGKYISGHFYGDSSWARPKPPWSWVDKFDTLRPGAWFFHPAYVFNRHFNLQRSEHYLYSLPMERILNTHQKALDGWVQEKVPSYFNDIPHGFLHKPLKKLRISAYRVAEFLFYLLGE